MENVTVRIDRRCQGRTLSASVMMVDHEIRESGKPIGQLMAEMYARCSRLIDEKTLAFKAPVKLP